jgi:hypothetical protein
LNTNFTTVNLTDLSTELGDLIDEMPNSASDLINQLTVNKMNIEMYQEKIVEPMIKNATAVIVRNQYCFFFWVKMAISRS